MVNEYPTIARRYMATLLDGLLVLAMLFILSYALQWEHMLVTSIRVLIVIGLFFVYEPFCTSKLCTLGQKIMGVRVRKMSNTAEKISLPSAYLRILVKIALGLVSFITIPFTRGKRGIHDFAVRSVVVYAE